jgi:hypothetical protein
MTELRMAQRSPSADHSVNSRKAFSHQSLWPPGLSWELYIQIPGLQIIVTREEPKIKINTHPPLRVSRLEDSEAFEAQSSLESLFIVLPPFAS